MVKKNQKRVNIHISEEAHTKAKIICALEQITMNEYFERAIMNSLKQDSKKVRKVFNDE